MRKGDGKGEKVSSRSRGDGGASRRWEKPRYPEHGFIAISHYTPRHTKREREKTRLAASLQYTIRRHVHMQKEKNKASLRPLRGRRISRFDPLPVRDHFTAVDIIRAEYDYY